MAATRKLALDQAVTGGITESAPRGRGGRSKDGAGKKPSAKEIEAVLRAGAHSQFGGDSEKQARAFMESSIEEIMARNTRKVVYDSAKAAAGVRSALGSISMMKVCYLLFTVTFHANRAHNLTSLTLTYLTREV